jgi:alkanesulfonate monooxygenase SsuD/methylene tetrahydromethanopterin reductase-like flavin-dependent oxidoreductase (luciferase family)
MNPVQFGVFLAPAAGDAQGIADRARVAERAGFDYVSVQDHPYVPAFLDTSTSSLSGKPPRLSSSARPSSRSSAHLHDGEPQGRRLCGPRTLFQRI